MTGSGTYKDGGGLDEVGRLDSDNADDGRISDNSRC